VAVVRLPSILAREAGGQRQFESDAATLAAALQELPIADLIFDSSGELRRLVNVYVNGFDARDDLGAPLAQDAEVRVVAAVAGGEQRRAI
jgi:molybdopterin converting factor small subunit